MPSSPLLLSPKILSLPFGAGTISFKLRDSFDNRSHRRFSTTESLLRSSYHIYLCWYICSDYSRCCGRCVGLSKKKEKQGRSVERGGTRSAVERLRRFARNVKF